jgi:hypothetical protein
MEGILGAYVGELVSQTGDLIFKKAEKALNLEQNMEKLNAFTKNIIGTQLGLTVINGPGSEPGAEVNPESMHETINKDVAEEVQSVGLDRAIAQGEKREQQEKKQEDQGHKNEEHEVP